MFSLLQVRRPEAINYKSSKRKQIRQLLVLTIPPFILVLIFSYLPIWGWAMSFVDYSPGVPILESKFVGLKYFISLFEGGSEFIRVMRNTLVLSFLGLLATPLPILLAIMITEAKGKWFKKAVQTVVSFPHFISWIVVFSITFSLFAVDDGMVNTILSKYNLITEPSNILADPNLTWFFMTITSLWKGAGYSAIVYIAAIAGIDSELYQAASVDGAGRLKQILHVTIPGIMPTFTVILILTIGNILNTGFDQYYTFYNPAVHDVIEVLDTYTYRIGIKNMDFAYATAVGVFKTVVSILMFGFANLLHKKVAGRTVI